MGFEEFLPNIGEDSEEELSNNRNSLKEQKKGKIGENQVYDVITSRKPDWQNIIYELIDSEQLDPWDIDIIVLTKKYFEKIAELEEADFYISSKVLLAAALLLRIKSEFLLNRYIKSIDDILFGKKDEQKYIFERIQIDENDVPLLIPKTPLPRLKRVTLPELLSALNKAINTESRRIKREVAIKIAKKLSEVDFPEVRRIDLKDRIKQFYAKILTNLKKKSIEPEKSLNKIGFFQLIGDKKDEKIACFLPLLHLSNSKKLWLEQEKYLDEIWIYLYDYFDKNREKFYEELQFDTEELQSKFDNSPILDNDVDEEIAREFIVDEIEKGINDEQNKDNKQVLEEEVRKELEEELKMDIKETEREIKIDKVTGFSDEQM